MKDINDEIITNDNISNIINAIVDKQINLEYKDKELALLSKVIEELIKRLDFIVDYEKIGCFECREEVSSIAKYGYIEYDNGKKETYEDYLEAINRYRILDKVGSEDNE